VSEARDATEALALVTQGGLDLVVADVRMPGLNGLELVRQIHEIEPDVPCIVIHGYASAESSIEALARGRVLVILEKAVSIRATSTWCAGWWSRPSSTGRLKAEKPRACRPSCARTAPLREHRRPQRSAARRAR